MKLTRRIVLQGGALAAAAINGNASATPASNEPAAASMATVHAPSPELIARERLLLDFGWRFAFGHADDPEKDFGFGADQTTYAKANTWVAKAAEMDFDDSGWRALDLPHDWAVELPFVPNPTPPPNGVEDLRAGHGFRPLGRAFPETSIGWYRREVNIPAGDQGRRLSLEFDGVFRDALVMFNGYILAHNESGYAPFRVDISDVANYGGKNVLVLRVDATLGEGWFYEGAGIYRHVWLVKTDPLHVPQWGVFVTSQADGDAANVSIQTELANESDGARVCQLVSTVLDAQGRAIARTASPATVAQRETQTIAQMLHIANPLLWSPDAPNLYRLKTELVDGSRLIDETTTTFGIRSIRFDAAHGFFLNGKPTKIKGTCNHQDHAGVGIALPDALQDFRIARLKEMGSNAYRTSHNPPTPELLDACDRLGMLVLDETRRMVSDSEGLSQLSRLIRRDRNHASVIMWSLGNEEWAQQTDARRARVVASLKRLARELDSTRPVTAALNENPFTATGIGGVLDVMGCNYAVPAIAAYHAQMPQQPIVCTETASTVSTRGVYVRDPASGYCVAYDTEHPRWASTAEEWWNIVAKAPYISGGFAWTGFDYRGEPTPFNRWPNVSSQFGILDLCGFPKDNFHYYKAWWQDAPVLHLFPHWNWRAGDTVKVWCHSNLDRVELFLNGQSLGPRDVVPCNHVEWDVPFAPGVIQARGYRNGAVVLSERRETTGDAAQIVLGADRMVIRADGEDVAVVTAMIADAQGRMVPDANHLVSFTVSGGSIIGVGNGDPRSHEPDKATQRAAFNGLCMALVQATKRPGAITLRATAPGLSSAALTIVAAPARPRRTDRDSA
jgi:beta-galactosidase